MINYANSIRTSKSVFGSMSNKTDEKDYWIPVANVDKTDEFVIKTKSKDKNKLAKQVGEGIVAVTIAAVGTVLFILNGGPKAFAKNAKKFSDFLDRQIHRSKLENDSISFVLKTLRNITNKLSEKFEAINNFNTIKDFSLQKILFGKNGKSKNVFAKVHRSITKLFNKIAHKTVLTSYGTAEEKLAIALKKPAINSDLKEVIEINGVKKTRAQWLEDVGRLNEEITDLFNEKFSKFSLTRRCKNYNSNAQKSINEYFKDKGFFWFFSKKTLDSFVAESALGNVRSNYKQTVQNFRKLITYSYQDLSNQASEYILKIAGGLNLKDKDNIKKLNEIEKGFKQLVREDNIDKNNSRKQILLQQIKELEQNLPMPQKNNIEIIEGLNFLKNSLNTFKQGKIEDVLEIYKKILSEKEYKFIEKAYKKGISSLDKAVNTETEDYSAKVRDLLVGSAPTDIISIVGGLATLGYFLAKSDDNNQRISVTLKHGIPILTGMATSLYGNAKLYAGSKSLFLGVASWFVTGKITGYLNDKFQQHVYKKNQIQTD